MIPLPPPSKKKKKEKDTCLVCVAHLLTGAWSNSQWPALKENQIKSKPAPLPEDINCAELHLGTLTTV